ncbi:MAG: transcriptional regulator GcvA [Rhodocyclaceae bacterium]|nr:transcriptional regulator GcvA [Rhodocyclaceae bacterium]
MVQSLPPLQSLRVFESAARHLSFKRAAEELHVTPAAVSQQIKALESHLDIVLFIRHPRGLALTEAGRQMWPMINAGMTQLAAGVEAARAGIEAPQLRVTVPPAFGARWLVHRLQGFTAANPDIDFTLNTALTTVDGSATDVDASDLLALREGDADVEVRFGHGHYPGMRADLVTKVRYVPVCHPDLLSGEHPLRTPEDLRFHTLIHDNTALDRSERVSWSDWLSAAEVSGVDASRGPHFSNSNLALEAAMDGLGVALAVDPLVDRDIAQGRLTMPFTVAMKSRYAYYVVSREDIAQRASVVRFREWLLASI